MELDEQIVPHATAIAMLSRGYSLREAAESCGVSVSELDTLRIKLIAEAYRMGFPVSRICRMYRCQAETVRSAARAHNVTRKIIPRQKAAPARKPNRKTDKQRLEAEFVVRRNIVREAGLSIEDVEGILCDRSEGFTFARIAQEYDTSARVVKSAVYVARNKHHYPELYV